MYNGGKIIIGLIIFIALVTFPFYTNMGKTFEKPADPTAEPDELHIGNIPFGQMRAEHMMMLDRWRDEVVRGGERYIEYDGDPYEKSIQNGCLACHSKQEFCGSCHKFAGVDPYCWNCHYSEEEGQI